MFNYIFGKQIGYVCLLNLEYFTYLFKLASFWLIYLNVLHFVHINWCIFHVMQIVYFACFAYFNILFILCMRQILRSCFFFNSIVAWFPIPWCNCSRTTTWISLGCLLLYCTLCQESQLILVVPCIILVLSTGTRGSSLSMEHNGMTYKTCSDSWH